MIKIAASLTIAISLLGVNAWAGSTRPDYELSARLSVDGFGARHDGRSDDSPAINAAIQSIGGHSGTVCLTPGVTYAIAQTVEVGNGGSAAASTLNGVVLATCDSGGGAADNSATLSWTGAAGGTMVRIAGPSQGNGLRSLKLNGGSAAAVAVENDQGSNGAFENLSITLWTGVAILNTTRCPSHTTVGNSWNSWTNIQAIGPAGPSANGMVLDGCPGSGADTTENTFSNMLLGYAGGPGTFGLKVGFADSNIFSNVAMIPAGLVYGKGGSDLVFAQTPTRPNFPYANLFLNFATSPNAISGVSGVGGNYFEAYNTVGGGALPALPHLSGMSVSGALTGTLQFQTSVTVAALPPCTVQLRGTWSQVSDALAPTYRGLARGGGSEVTPVWCNGSVWETH